MSAETVTINGLSYVLLPHIADWSTEPQLSIRWETKVAPGITGAEDRARMRGVPLHGLKWSITPRDESEEERIEARVQAAKRSGVAAAPWFGHGMVVTSSGTGSSTIPVEASPWIPEAGDWVILLTGADASQPRYEAFEVLSVASNVITVDGTFSSFWPGGSLCYQLIAGAFSAESHEMLMGDVGKWSFAIENEKPSIIAGAGTPSVEEFDIYYGRVGMDAAGTWITTEASLESPQFLFWGGLEMSKLTSATVTSLVGDYIYTSVIGSTLTDSDSEASITIQALPWSSSDLEITQFDGATLGVLDSVDLTLTTHIRCAPRFENLTFSAQVVHAGMDANVRFYYPSTNVIGDVPDSVSSGTSVYSYDGTTDYGGPPGANSGYTTDPPLSDSASDSVSIDSSHAEYVSLIGSGTLTFTADPAATEIAYMTPGPNGSGTLSHSNLLEVGATLHATWHYHPWEGYWLFAIADATPVHPAAFSKPSLAPFPMASLADLGGAAPNRGEIGGFGYEQVEDFGGNVFKMFRSKTRVPAGGGVVRVV
jgi:hypothetical protein